MTDEQKLIYWQARKRAAMEDLETVNRMLGELPATLTTPGEVVPPDDVESLKNKISELEFIIQGVEEGSDCWKSEYDNCRSILTELVELKNDKDANGKTEVYLIKQPKVWEAAKKFLENYQHGYE